MKFSVAHVAGNTSFWQELETTETLTLEQAIQRSKLLTDFTDLDITQLKVGVFGKICNITQLLQEGDRVEVYLPAIVQDIDDDEED